MDVDEGAEPFDASFRFDNAYYGPDGQELTFSAGEDYLEELGQEDQREQEILGRTRVCSLLSRQDV